MSTVGWSLLCGSQLPDTRKVSANLDPSQIYRPPVATSHEPAGAAQGATFYVVSVTKLTVMFIGTLGLYQIYWFYKHWQHYKAHTGENVKPVLRGIFAIFFVHKLFAAIHASGLSRVEAAGFKHASAANVFAILTIVSVVIDRVASRTTELGVLDLVGTAIGLAVVLPLRSAQAAANRVSGDATGSSNSSYGAASIVALLLGGAVWLLLVVAMTLPDV